MELLEPTLTLWSNTNEGRICTVTVVMLSRLYAADGRTAEAMERLAKLRESCLLKGDVLPLMLLAAIYGNEKGAKDAIALLDSAQRTHNTHVDPACDACDNNARDSIHPESFT